LIRRIGDASTYLAPLDTWLARPCRLRQMAKVLKANREEMEDGGTVLVYRFFHAPGLTRFSLSDAKNSGVALRPRRCGMGLANSNQSGPESVLALVLVSYCFPMSSVSIRSSLFRSSQWKLA